MTSHVMWGKRLSSEEISGQFLNYKAWLWWLCVMLPNEQFLLLSVQQSLMWPTLLLDVKYWSSEYQRMALSFTDKLLKWGYDVNNGPRSWGQWFPVAEAGVRQSPIDIRTQESQVCCWRWVLLFIISFISQILVSGTLLLPTSQLSTVTWRTPARASSCISTIHTSHHWLADLWLQNTRLW